MILTARSSEPGARGGIILKLRRDASAERRFLAVRRGSFEALGGMTQVLCICSDMIFATKIRGTAAALGCELELLRPEDLGPQHFGAAAGMVIIDLGAAGQEPIGLIQRFLELRPPPRVIAYVSHVETELAAAARAAGAAEVLPRSAFVSRLPELLSAV